MVPIDGICRFLCAGIILTACLGSVRAEGELDEIRRKARKNEPKEASPSHSHGYCDECCRSPCCCDGDHETFLSIVFGDLVGRAVLFTVASPAWVPHVMLNDDFHHWAEFPDAPYADDRPGSLVINEAAALNTSPWMAQLTAEAGTDFGDLNRVGGRWLVDTSSRIGFDGEFFRLDESLVGASDALWIGDLNVVYRFAQSEHAQFRAGLGANWMADDDELNAGINFTYSIDVYPVRPWVIKNGIDYGTLGHTNRFHYRGTVGVQIHDIEVFSGYDYQHLGGQDLHMLVTGLTVWFQ